MTRIDHMTRIAARKSLECALCNEPTMGACVQCCHGENGFLTIPRISSSIALSRALPSPDGCDIAFHVTCAQQAGLDCLDELPDPHFLKRAKSMQARRMSAELTICFMLPSVQQQLQRQQQQQLQLQQTAPMVPVQSEPKAEPSASPAEPSPASDPSSSSEAELSDDVRF